MRAETIVGWRDTDHYPGEVEYTQRPAWDASAIAATAATLDPVLLGGVQQMLDDNQFFATVERQMQEKNLRVTASLLSIPVDYVLIKAQAPVSARLPMAPGQPDFVFSDEEDGVVAFKHGTDIFYASLYWRANFGINGLARVHFIQPNFDRVAVVRQETQFTPSGETFTRRDWINMGSAGGGRIKYPGDLHSALTGEVMPIAKVPEGVAFKPGDENVYAGRGDFYTLRYGPYLIGMNMSQDKTFDLAIPKTDQPVTALGSAETLDASQGATMKVGPRSTVVYFFHPAE